MSISQPLAAGRDVDMPTGKTGMTGSIQYDEPQSGSPTLGWRAVTIRERHPGAGERDRACGPGSEVSRDDHGTESDAAACGVQKKSDALRAVPASEPVAEHLRDITADDLNTALSSLIDKLQRHLAEINRMLAHW